MKLYRTATGTYQVPGQQDKKAERIEVPTDSNGLCAFLNDLRAADGEPGCEEAVINLPIERPTFAAEKVRDSYVEQSVSFEDSFDAMPLALQLHYAARAMENAREALPISSAREEAAPNNGPGTAQASPAQEDLLA